MTDYLQTVVPNDYLQALIIIAGSILIGWIIYFIFNRYLTRLAKHSKTDIDDLLIRITSKPIYLLITVTGFYFGLKSLDLLAKYLTLINRIYFVVAVFIVAVAMSRILSLIVARWLKVERRFEKTPRLINKFVTVLIYIIALLIILHDFNVEISPLIATLGVGGIAVGLALQSTLSNFFAGIYIVSDNPFNVGDYVEVPALNVSGYIEDIGWRTTRVRTLPNTIIIVPNAKLADSVVTNTMLPDPETAALVQCGVAYTSDLRHVERVTNEVAKQIQQTVPGAVKEFEPFIRYNTFGDSNINFTIILRVQQTVDRFLVIHELFKALTDRYNKEGIEISWPVRKIFTSGDLGKITVQHSEPQKEKEAEDKKNTP